MSLPHSQLPPITNDLLQYVYVVDLDCARTHTVVRCQQFVATASAYQLYANLIIRQPDFVCCLRTQWQYFNVRNGSGKSD